MSEWNQALSAALGVPPAEIDAVLDLASFAAHTIIRPAAPLTTFLVGFATAKYSQDRDVATALAEAVAIAHELTLPDERS